MDVDVSVSAGSFLAGEKLAVVCDRRPVVVDMQVAVVVGMQLAVLVGRYAAVLLVVDDDMHLCDLHLGM